jgi:hypothetical protein
MKTTGGDVPTTLFAVLDIAHTLVNIRQMAPLGDPQIPHVMNSERA